MSRGNGRRRARSHTSSEKAHLIDLLLCAQFSKDGLAVCLSDFKPKGTQRHLQPNRGVAVDAMGEG